MTYRIMRKFKISEISAIDRGANEHAKSVIIKRADNEKGTHTMDILDICKFFNATGNSKWFDGSLIGKGVIDQGVIYKEIEKRAIEDSPGGESVAKAFSRYIAENETGKQLYKAMRNAPKPVQAAQDLVDVKPTEPKAEDLEAEAQELARGGMSITQARIRVQSNMVRRARDKATRDVEEQRKPIWDAERENERDWRLGEGSVRLSPRTLPSPPARGLVRTLVPRPRVDRGPTFKPVRVRDREPTYFASDEAIP